MYAVDQIMIYRLIILNGDRRGEQITLTQAPMIIGRAETCDIRFNDPEIALSHAEITHTPDGLYIRDLGSMNRLLINNREVRAAHPKHGDVVEVGHTRFLVQAYVQAEVTGKVEEEIKDEDKRWRIAGGVLLLLVIAVIIFIPRCEHHMKKLRARPNSTILLPPPNETEVDQPHQVLPPPETNAMIPQGPLVDIQSRHDGSAGTPRPTEIQEIPQGRAKPPAEPTVSQQEPNPEKPIKPTAVNKHETEAVPITVPPKQETVLPLKVTPKAEVPLVLPAGRLITILETDINKFPESDQFKEMRLLTIRLSASVQLKEIDAEAVRVEVTFLEKNKFTGQISPVLGEPKVLTVQGKWPTDEQKSVATSYVVPATKNTSERLMQYYGFIIRVYYSEKLQDELRQPKNYAR